MLSYITEARQEFKLSNFCFKNSGLLASSADVQSKAINQAYLQSIFHLTILHCKKVYKNSLHVPCLYLFLYFSCI